MVEMRGDGQCCAWVLLVAFASLAVALSRHLLEQGQHAAQVCSWCVSRSMLRGTFAGASERTKLAVADDGGSSRERIGIVRCSQERSVKAQRRTTVSRLLHWTRSPARSKPGSTAIGEGAWFVLELFGIDSRELSLLMTRWS